MDQQAKLPFLGDGGDMGARIRAHNWFGTLGPAAAWHPSLKTLVGVMLAAVQPMFIAWGPRRTLLYNDAYVPLLGQKHPDALGRPFMETWSEVRDELTPLFDQVFAGRPIHMDDITLFLDRHGRREEAHFAFSYTPVFTEGGMVAGLFCSCTVSTAQVLAERGRQEETDRQRRLFQQAPGFMAILRGPDLAYEFVNDAFVRLFGDRGYVGRTAHEAFPELESQGLLELMGRVCRTGERYVARNTPVRFGGAPGQPSEELFLDFIFEPVVSKAGAVTGLFIEGYDVTDAHRATEALRRSEARLREMNAGLERRITERSLERSRTWQVSPDLLGALGPDAVFQASNPAWKSMLGWTEEEVASMSVFELVHPDDVERTRAGFQSMQQGQPAIRFENRYRRKDGGYRWISWVGVPEEGMVYCSGRDITAEKEQAAELAERTRERDRVWRNSRDLLVVIDTVGRFKVVSPAAKTILGWTPEEMVGRTVFDFTHPNDHPSTGSALEHATHDTLSTYENRYRHKDGTYRWMSWVAAPEGDLIYAAARHVTAEKQAAEALRQTEEQLRQSQKMEAVGQLTGGLAHDFNNLLAGISGSLELMQTRLAQGRTGDLGRYLDAAQGAAKRAAALTHRLLAFTRRQTLDPRPTDANRLVAGMDELVRRTAGPAVAVDIIAAPALWTTLVDPNQLENALLNLCINARDAMPDGGRLTVSTGNAQLGEANGQDLPPGQYVTLCVSDTGTGMTPEVVRRAFDPFFTTKPIGMGTGLGLSMIYGFVQQSGGQARVQSAPGEGTTVCLYLPRHFGEADAPEEPSGLAAAPRAGQGETVLVVDDEPTVRMLVGEVLQELGYTAIEAADGATGLQVLRSGARVDLLVTDVGLPGLNGRQVADAARAMRPGLQVLFITGYAENAILNHGHLEPGMSVLVKPFTMEVLAGRIKEMIAGGGDGKG